MTVTVTAAPRRDEGRDLLIPSVWTGPRRHRLDRDTVAAARPHLATGRWLDYLGDDQAEDALRAAYGPNHDRLKVVKRHYDPDNIFHLNDKIAPSPHPSLPAEDTMTNHRTLLTRPLRALAAALARLNSSEFDEDDGVDELYARVSYFDCHTGLTRNLVTGTIRADWG